MSEQTFTPTKPFLKWAGNKFRIINKVRDAILASKGSRAEYIEPFGGSGAVIANVQDVFATRVYGEYNRDLAELMEDVQSMTEKLVGEINALFVSSNNTQDAYYALRQEFNSLRNAHRGLRMSALFVYLNRHCFNGLCRYGPNGFNVPIGRYKAVTAPVDEIRDFARRFGTDTQIVSGDFEPLIERASSGSVVYCDPPYFPLSVTSSFTQYSAGDDFGFDAQVRLAKAAQRAASRGAVVLISNHETPQSLEVYESMDSPDVRIDTTNRFSVPRFISAKGEGRGKPSPELIAVFRPRSNG